MSCENMSGISQTCVFIYLIYFLCIFTLLSGLAISLFCNKELESVTYGYFVGHAPIVHFGPFPFDVIKKCLLNDPRML